MATPTNEQSRFFGSISDAANCVEKRANRECNENGLTNFKNIHGLCDKIVHLSSQLRDLHLLEPSRLVAVDLAESWEQLAVMALFGILHSYGHWGSYTNEITEDDVLTASKLALPTLLAHQQTHRHTHGCDCPTCHLADVVQRYIA